MEGKFQYKRSFLIFNQEDSGFGIGQEPSGYVKTEVRDGLGKASLSIQNLKDENGRITYSAYIIKHSEKQFYPVLMGCIALQRNKGELQWEFDPGNVAESGFGIDEFNIAVVLAEYNDGASSGILCPLAAYKGSKPEWRQRMGNTLKPLAEEKPEAVEEVEEVEAVEAVEDVEMGRGEDSAPDEIESQSTVEETDRADIVSSQIEAVDDIKLQSSASEGTEEAEEEMDVISKYDGGIESVYVPEEVSRDMEKPESNADTADEVPQLIQPVDITERDMGSDLEKTAIGEENDKDTSWAGRDEYEDIPKDNDFFGFAEYKEMLEKRVGEPLKNDTTAPSYSCPYGVNEPCAEKPQGVSGTQCPNCPAQAARAPAANAGNSTGNLEKLRQNLDTYFEAFNPFGSRKGNYKWWKISSPVYLNNILYQCNIKTPLLFNPSLMMAHFKYRHLLLGIYIDRVRRREYVVCGVPGVYSLDDRPFGELCRWVQLEGYKPKYGAFGYWLVYIDPKTGKLLKVN